MIPVWGLRAIIAAAVIIGVFCVVVNLMASP